MYAYSDHGMAFRAWHDPRSLRPGEVFFDHHPTDEEIAQAFPNYPRRRAEAQRVIDRQSAIVAGCKIECQSAPPLNGVYATDPASLRNVRALAANMATSNRLPGGGAAFNFTDMSGRPHSFTLKQFIAFARALEDYAYAVEHGAKLPAQPVVIP